MKWKEVSVVTEEKCVEAVAGILHRMGSGGVIIEDPRAARNYTNQREWDSKSIPADFLQHEFIIIKAYFPEERAIEEELNPWLQLVRNTFNSPCRVFTGKVKDEDWKESWKKYYHTFKIGDRIIVKPSWEAYQKKNGEIVIEIDPGMAFGTGIHASTRFCLKFLDKYIEGEEKVIDAGCGSGILSIAAAKLGSSSVMAMDIDEVAVRIARENIKLNHLQESILVEEGNIVEAIKHQQADIVVANMTAEIIALLIPGAIQALSSGGYLFGSGIVDSRWPGVKKLLEESGFAIEQIITEADWVGVAARKI